MVAMKAKEFLNQLQHDEIVAAVREAEQKTSGEIRVFISRKPMTDPVVAARAEFVRLGMARTRERNGVLILVAPRTRQFAVIGDAGIHAHCGEDFWQQIAAEMSVHFRNSKFTAGIVHGIRKAGELLSQHFPRSPDDRNELSDAVERD